MCVRQVESQYEETDLVPRVTQTDSMEGFEHVSAHSQISNFNSSHLYWVVSELTNVHFSLSQEECRLQLEAQRISLSQIHAAQLELLKERLPEWEEPGKQGGAKGICI